jgi:O-methyltransferase involved in polyketide biosynthesis
MVAASAPLMTVSQRTLGTSLEPWLLARHHAIDALLTAAIESGEISQVLEVASGMSPRGWRFASRYGSSLTYLETDLPGMTARKRRALAEMGSLSAHHRCEELDGLRESGPGSLTEVCAALEPGQGLAIITEGLLNYLHPDSLVDMWERFARTLRGFAHGRYLSDLLLGDLQTPSLRLPRLGLARFVRGPVNLHFDSAEDTAQRLLACGFGTASVERADRLVPAAPRGASVVHIVNAATG